MSITDTLLEALRPQVVKALDGHTKYSRDCHMDGEYLADQAWPAIVSTVRAAVALAEQRGEPSEIATLTTTPPLVDVLRQRAVWAEETRPKLTYTATIFRAAADRIQALERELAEAKAAVDAEREACVFLAETVRDEEAAERRAAGVSEMAAYHLWAEQTAEGIAKAIRARGQQ